MIIVLSGITPSEEVRQQGCVAPSKSFRELLQALYLSSSAINKATANPKGWASHLADFVKRICDLEGTNQVLIGPECPTDHILEGALIKAIRSKGLQPFELSNGKLKKI